MAPAPSVEAAPQQRRAPRLLLDTLSLSVIAGGAKIAGAVKSIAIAHAFGSGPALDSYLLAFLIPSVLADTFCGALVPVTVPRLIELERHSGRDAMLAFYARLLARSVRFSLLGAATIAGLIGTFLAASARTNPWPPVALLAMLMLPVIPCNAVANVWRSLVNAQNKFAAAAATVVFTPAMITLAVLTAGVRGGVWMLAAATTLGAAGELLLLAFAIRRSGFAVAPRKRCDFTSGRIALTAVRLNAFRREYGYLVLSGAVSGVTFAAAQAMAARLGEGSVSVLNYGTRVSALLMAIGPAALGVTMLPRLSRVAAECGGEEFKRVLRNLLSRSFAAAGIATAIFILLSSFIVRVTLQHGAFTAADTGTVAAVQACSLLQIPFVVGSSVLMRAFSVLEANRVLLPLSAAALAVNLGLNYTLMNRYGVSGIALASSIAQALAFTAMAWLVFGPAGNKLSRERP